MTEPTQGRGGGARKLALVVAVAAASVLVVAVGAVGYHAVATSAYRASFLRTRALFERAENAATASRMEPWNARFAVRSQVMSDWLRGLRLLDAGDYNAAVDVLAAAYRHDVGDEDLLALFQGAQETQSLETVRKAHLQHGHEGPGGTLRPQDIER